MSFSVAEPVEAPVAEPEQEQERESEIELEEELEEEIKSNEIRKSRGDKWYRKFYTRNDYCDKRISTNLTQFNYCPLCGKKIDWKAIKGGANG